VDPSIRDTGQDDFVGHIKVDDEGQWLVLTSEYIFVESVWGRV
jgi:hypothetical protein